MNEKQAMEYLNRLTGGGIRPGLDCIRELCRRLGDPQKRLKFVHIAGTNGKGSVLCFTSTILQCAGYRVGRYLSPTIRHYRERIQVNGRMISGAGLGRVAEQVKEAAQAMASDGFPSPTLFEAETAMAFLYFLEKKCDIVVLETGMGGLLDATNVVENTLVEVITSVGMDHMQFLGSTPEEIARQKAGIIKPGSTVVCLHQDSSVEQVVRDKALEAEAEFVMADPGEARSVRYGLKKQTFSYGEYGRLEMHLAGKFQIANAVLSICACEALREKGFPVSARAFEQGLSEARWDGRMTVIGDKPLFVIDGAHNEDAAEKLADSIEFYFTKKRIIYIIGVLRDKEYQKVIRLTERFADQIITVTPPGNPRALSALELAEEVVKVHPAVTAASSLEEAVEMARLLAGSDGVILAFGSLSYLGRLMDICGYPSEGKRKRTRG